MFVLTLCSQLPYPGHNLVKVFADGTRYEGEWKYGKAHGEGQIKFGSYGTVTCPPVKAKNRRKEQQREAHFPQVFRVITS